MKKIVFHLLVMVVLICGSAVMASVEDYIIYDDDERGGTNFTAIVSVDINHYYAFSEPDLIINYYKEIECYDSREQDETGRKTTIDEYWISVPYLNARQLLINHSLWIFDISVTEVMKGEMETNRCFVVMKKTPAYLSYESPMSIIKRKQNGEKEKIILGLEVVSKDEVVKSFSRGKCMYIRDDVEKFYTPEMNKSVEYIEILTQNIRDIDIDAKCYVVRDVGIGYKSGDNVKALRKLVESARARKTGRTPLSAWAVDKDVQKAPVSDKEIEEIMKGLLQQKK